MRFFKVFSIAVVALLILLTTTYIARIAVINNLAKEQLSLANIKLTCLDFSLASNMNIVVDKLCLKSPKANIEIFDTKVQWQYSPEFTIINVDVKQANVIGTEHLFSEQGHDTENNEADSNSQISSLLQPYVKQIKQLNLPTNINVSKLTYLPFDSVAHLEHSNISSQRPLTTSYIASLSAVNNSIYFSLKNANNVEFIKVTLDRNKSTNKQEEGFTIGLNSKLTILKNFINVHQLPIKAELQNILSHTKISGDINSVITYKNDKLSVHNQITELDISAENGVSKSGPFQLTGALNFHSQLALATNKTLNSTSNDTDTDTDTDNSISLKFSNKNTVSLNYSQPHLMLILEEKKVSSALISILKDNPLTNLTIMLADNATLSLNDKNLNLSDIEVTAYGDEREHLIELTNVDFSLAKDKNEISAQPISNLAIERFIIDSEIKLADIASYTTLPVSLHLEGSLDKANQKTMLSLTKNSLVTAKNIMLTKQHAKAKKAKILLGLKTLSSTFEGNLQLLDNKLLSVSLKTQSQASQINVPKTLQINSFELMSEIKGNLDDIQINATTSADGVNLGSIIVSGPALTPKIQVAADDLQLTDLLSLNIQLPTKVELIDGLLDYSVTGQVTDLNDIKNTPLSASVAVTSASGDIDGVWLQELNWQQHFTILAGKITTTPSKKENLTVELIETPTPISKLSINTNWTFNKHFKLSANKLKADVLGGSFSIPTLQWPFEHGHSVNVQLESIDLEQVLALDKKQGIVVTGDISGQLPVTFDGEKYIIEDGELHNISNGLIQVIDNPAVAELKASNSQLQLAFDALQNLHYHQLSSAVSMGDDGYMLLETVIKGRNPDIDNDVNLNLNLSYDLLGLLESLSITQRFEESIIKGLQKNKE